VEVFVNEEVPFRAPYVAAGVGISDPAKFYRFFSEEVWRPSQKGLV